MNYRHSFHAGNFADVFKHALWQLCLAYFNQKDKPYLVVDTHAGIGMYDLRGEQAQKTQEWELGVGRLLAAQDVPAALQPYLNEIRALNTREEAGIRWYPGSPWLTQQTIRAQDQAVFCELHPLDGEQLKQNFYADERIQVETQTNGYQALKAKLPPRQKRGAVLIDPPFEQTDEFAQVVSALQAGLKRFATGTYVVWYPIKDPLSIGQFHQQVKALNPPKTYAVDLLIRDPEDAQRLNGCGMLFINPPFGVLQQVPEIMPWLTALLAQAPGASWQAQWVVAE